MKLILFTFLAFLAQSSFSQTERVWEKIENAPVITIENAADFSTYENTPESVLNFFFASRIRKDKEWEKVVPLPGDRTEKMQLNLKSYETWNITAYNLVSKTQYNSEKFKVKVNFEIRMNGKVDGGIDQVEVRLINGKWLVTEIPT